MQLACPLTGLKTHPRRRRRERILNLCEALDVDPEAVRDGLTKWTEQRMAGQQPANPGLGKIARLLAHA